MITCNQESEVTVIKPVIVRVSEEAHQKLKIKTLQEGTTIQKLLSDFINDYIKEPEKKETIKAVAYGDGISQTKTLSSEEYEKLKRLLQIFDEPNSDSKKE